MSKSKITGKVLVIQPGRKETQIVLMGNGTEILYGTTVETPSGAVEDGVIRNPDALRDMLKATLKAPEFKRVKQVVFSVCTSQVITESVAVPALPDAKLEKLLQANMDMYFPVDVHDYHMVWQRIGMKEDSGDIKEVNVQLWAIPISLLKRYYKLGNDCGLSVAAIDYCGHSLATAVGASYTRNEKKAAKARKKLDLNQPITFGKKKGASAPAPEAEAKPRQAVDTELHVLMEQDLLGMTFVQNGQVVLQRCVRCGSQPSYQFGELAMMLEYFRSMDIGRGSNIRGIASGIYAADVCMIEELQDALGIPFMRLPVPYDVRWVLCVGAARTELDFGVSSFNAPGKTHTDMQSQLWQYAMILAGGLAVLAVFMYILNARIGWDAEISQLESETQILQVRSAKSNGFADNYNAYVSNYNSYSNDWDKVFGSLHATNNNLVRVMEELEEMMPEDSSVLGMQIGSTGMTVTLACDDKEEAAYIMREMREMKYIDVNVVFSDLSGGGKGAAKTYGSQDADDTVEAPPVEGSKVDAAEETAKNIMKALAKDGALEELSFTDLEIVQKAYGQIPTFSSILSDRVTGGKISESDKSKLNSDLNVIGTNSNTLFKKRVDAMNEMFAENAFAVDLLMDVLRDNTDYIISNGYVADMLQLDFTLIQYINNPSALIPDNLKEARDFQSKFEQVFYQTQEDNKWVDSTERLQATENLIKKSSKLTNIYKYYLAAEIDSDVYDSLTFFDVDNIRTDLEDGELSVKKTELDKKLNKLVYVVEPGETTAPTTQPTTPNTQPATPTTEPTTEPTTVATQPADSDINEQLKNTIKLYLLVGGSGNEAIDSLLEAYVNTGTVNKEDVKDAAASVDIELTDAEVEKIKAAADDFIESLEEDQKADVLNIAAATKEFLAEVEKILNKNPDATTETTETTETTDVTEATDPTGETVAPTETTTVVGDIELSADVSPQYVLTWLKNYITTGDCGLTGEGMEALRAEVNAEMRNYFEFGINNPLKITATIEYLIAIGGVDAEVKEVLKDCYLHQSSLLNTSHPLVAKILTYLQNDGTCGNSTLDACFKRCLNSIHEDIFGQLLAGSGSGEESGGGSSGQYADTRTFFTAFLTYGQEMMSNELERKGLSYADKIAEKFTDILGGNN